MAEAVANFSECEQGALHVDEDFAAVEFIPSDDGINSTVVGTNFTNPAMPLLRYDVGDTARVMDTGCPCGRPGRVVNSVDGRFEDYVILQNGTRIGRLDHAFKDLVNVREAQIRQSRPESLTVRVVRGSRYRPEDEVAMLSELRRRLGSDIEILVEHVDSIPRGRGGKLRFVVSELNDGQVSGVQAP